MKRLLIILFSTGYFMAGAQQYSNEWIDYGKTYYKFKVPVSGLYRISHATLAGVNLGNTDAAHFQLWRNGAEVPIYTSTQNGPLATGGYIEFWGEANDGKPDSLLYREYQDQINNTRSLFSDTATYFLTVNPAAGNKRLLPTANTANGAAPEPYFMYTRTIAFNESIHFGSPEGSGTGILYTSSYEQGKGWASNDITNGQSRTITEKLFAYTSGGAPEVRIKMNAVGNAGNVRNIKLSVNGNDVFDHQLQRYDYVRLSKVMAANTFNGTNENFSISNLATNTDRVRVALIEITYPRLFTLGGTSSFRFTLPASNVGRYLEIADFSFSGVPLLYDLSNGRRYEADATNPALLKIYLQPSAVAQDLVMVSQDASAVKNVLSFEQRNFVNYLLPANQGDYMMITHTALLTGSDGAQPVDEYRAYRASAAGGGYNAKVYMIDQLTDQFAYGIKNSPAAVRNFTRWARDKFSVRPRMVFLLGKGITFYHAKIYENTHPTEIARLNLVPTMGNPGSDVLLTTQGSSSVPLTPIGRVSVINGDELLIYLNKIKEYDAQLANTSPLIVESAWKKNVAHIVGANDQQTINLLYFLLNAHKGIIIDTLYGTNVNDFVKSYTSTTQQTLTERLSGLINSGIGILTYFGHSSATSLSFNLDDPMNYNNQGKYALFNMMGCNVGDIFGLNTARVNGPDVLSEKYVLAKSRGCIGMMAGTSIGYVNTLDFYNSVFYKQLSVPLYGKTVGEQMQQTIRNVLSVTGENAQFQRSQCEQYTLNGDPAIRLYQFPKPDYAIEGHLVDISPNFISIAEPDFKVGAKMMNLGKAASDSIVIELKRTYPDFTTKIIQRDTIKGIRYIDSILYKVPIDPVKDKGQNKITITIDPANAISELYETNNSITKDVFIFEDELRPIFPYNHSIVNKQGIKFAASAANPFATSRNYLFELDTTAMFNSTVKFSQSLSSPGGVIEFAPSFTFRDSVVYYWRVAPAPAPNTPANWNQASFTYINNSEPGFSQSHYYQFLDNEYKEVELEADRVLRFKEKKATMRVSTGIYPYAPSFMNVQFSVNDIIKQGGWLAPFSSQANSLRFYVADHRSMKPMENADLGTTGRFGSQKPVPHNVSTIPKFFQFDISTSQARKNVMDFLDSIPQGFYLSVTGSIFQSTVLPAVWQADTSVFGSRQSLYHKFVELGATRLNEVNSFVPYLFVMQKGSNQAIVQKIGSSPNQILDTTFIVKTISNQGYIATNPVGSATQWNKVSWKSQSPDFSDNSDSGIEIIGIKQDGSQSVILNNVPFSSNEADISFVDAKIYPKIIVRLNMLDTISYSPYKIRNLLVKYTPAPEGAIAPNLYFSMKDTLDAGEPVNMGVAFKNVSYYNFDSLSVKLTLKDANNVERLIPLPKLRPLVSGDTVRVSVPLDTRSLAGKNIAYLEFNPLSNHQPEQFQFNNFLYKDFYVKADSTSPYLDVTFDGTRILNKDIVSSKPDILMKLSDDARWLLLNNPGLVKVQLKYPDGAIKEFSYNNDTLVFTPASQNTGEKNTAHINFRPHLNVDGHYELIVSAKDESGNQAGDLQYRVAFQVINKPMISNLLNYPNPFTTSTAFVFTLTGSEVPQNMRIQILTITGKIVREITKNELGPVKIGRNITEFKWDGTDQYGQKLANGVYLYRVITNLNGKSLDKYTAPDDKTDKYFNKGYGKMYLMR